MILNIIHFLIFILLKIKMHRTRLFQKILFHFQLVLSYPYITTHFHSKATFHLITKLPFSERFHVRGCASGWCVSPHRWGRIPCISGKWSGEQSLALRNGRKAVTSRISLDAPRRQLDAKIALLLVVQDFRSSVDPLYRQELNWTDIIFYPQLGDWMIEFS